MPPEDVVPEKVAAPPANPEDPIAEEQEGDVSTVESAEEQPVAEEENADPVPEEEEAPATETKEIAATTEEKSDKPSYLASCGACCDGDVLKNVQAAVGLV